MADSKSQRPLKDSMPLVSNSPTLLPEVSSPTNSPAHPKALESSEKKGAPVVPPTLPPVEPAVPVDHERYHVLNFHARGGMGEVWLSKDSRLNREVAVKKLTAKGERAKARFLAEAEVTGQLEHPAIVPVHDVGVDAEGQPFYVMKFVRGRSLKNAIEEYYAPGGKPGTREVLWNTLLQIFVDLCQAVAYAH